MPPAAAGSRARPMWGDCTSSMVFGCWVLLGAQAGVGFGRDGDWLVRQTPSWQSRILRHVTPARPPPSLTAPGRQLSFCRRGRDLGQRRAAGRADAAAEQRAVPPRGRVPAGRRRRRTAVARAGGTRSLTIPNQGLEGRTAYVTVDCDSSWTRTGWPRGSARGQGSRPRLTRGLACARQWRGVGTKLAHQVSM